MLKVVWVWRSSQVFLPGPQICSSVCKFLQAVRWPMAIPGWVTWPIPTLQLVTASRQSPDLGERESKVSESFYSTNKVNVRPHSVRVGESLPATALCFQSPRCFDKKINHIIWAPPIERVWWQFILGFQVFGENGWVKNYFFTSYILLYSYRSKWIHVPKLFP